MNRKLGAVPLLGGGAATISVTTSPAPRFTSVPSYILIYPAVWAEETWAENWGGRLRPAPFLGRGARSPSYTIWAEA